MSEHVDAERPLVPRRALIAAWSVVGLAIVLALGARLTGLGTMAQPEGEVVELRELRFEDRADGAVAVFEGDAAIPVEVMPAGTNGFVRGTLRGLARERKQHGIGLEVPFELARWSTGEYVLEDPATGRQIYLAAFGPTNLESFAQLMTAGTQ